MNIHEVVHLTHRAPYNMAVSPPILNPVIADLFRASLQTIAKEPDLTRELGFYAHLSGLPRLVTAFTQACTHDFSRPVTAAEVLVTPGAQSALRYIQEWIRQQGQRLLFPVGLEFFGSTDKLNPHEPSIGVPRWTSETESLYRIQFEPDSFDWNNVGAVILSQPHNPTGRSWHKDDLTHLAKEAAKHDTWLILDETYGLPFGPLVLPNTRTTIDAPNVIHIYSFSKTGLASERIGVLVAPSEPMAALRMIAKQQAILASSLGQRLAIAMIDHLHSYPQQKWYWGNEYHYRWHQCYKQFQQANIEQFKVLQWQGGQFLWLYWQGLPDSTELFHRLLHDGVGVVPAASLQIMTARTHPISGIRIGLGGPENNLYAGVKQLITVLKAV